MIIPNIISHLATLGKASIAPVGPTGPPHAGPTLAIDVHEAVKAVKNGKPERESSTLRTPKLRKIGQRTRPPN